MMINISLSSEDIAQLNLLRDLMNFIRNGCLFLYLELWGKFRRLILTNSRPSSTKLTPM